MSTTKGKPYATALGGLVEVIGSSQEDCAAIAGIINSIAPKAIVTSHPVSTLKEQRPEMVATPRTDALDCCYIKGKHARLVPSNFARQLERENAELRGKLERLDRFMAGVMEWEHAVMDGDPASPDCVTPARFVRAILNEASK